MTFMLKDTGTVDPNGPLSHAVPERAERVAAQFRLDQVSTDSMGLQSAHVERTLLSEIQGAIGPDPDAPAPTRPYRSSEKAFQVDRARALRQVADLRAFDPDTFGSLPTTPEEFDREVLRRRRAELDDLMDLLQAAPSGGWAPELAGSLGAGIWDPWTALTLPFGAAGRLSVPMTAAIEGVAGAAGEALSLPDQFRAARELGMPDPNVPLQLAFAAGLSGALGGAGAAAGRYIQYRRTGRAAGQAARPSAEAPLEFGAALDEADGEMLQARADGRPALASPQDGPAADRAPAPGQPLTMGDFDFSATGNASPRGNRIGYVFGRLLERGVDPHLAAGFLGNFVAESGPGLDTAAIGDNGNALGMAQWNGPRRRELERFAQSRGKPATDLDTQIDFLFHELETSEAKPWARIREARDAGEAARLISDLFERPGTPHLPRRLGAARSIMTQYSQGGVPRWTGPLELPDDAPAAGFSGYRTSRAYTGTGEMTVGDDMRVSVEYQVVDLADLRQATGDLQPRDRARAASDAWVTDTAARLDPARLMDSPEADRGAPLVGPDNIIESGNGRVRAIGRAYELGSDRAAAYRQQIEERTGATIPEGIERPVLIARRTSALDDAARRQLVVDAQDSGVARMTATERAQIGQRALGHDLLQRLDPDRVLTSAENRDFARAFAARFPRSERNAFIDEKGNLSIDGVRQMQDSLFARAYEAMDILARYVEAAPGELRSLMDALSAAAPRIARLRAAIAAGDVSPEMDITPFLLDAVRLIAGAREVATAEGGKLAEIVEEALASVDLLDGGAVAPLTAALVRKIMPGGRQASARAITDFLNRYADEALAAGQGGGLLGAPGPLDVLKAVDRASFGDLTETGRPSSPEARPVTVGALAEGASFDQGATSEGALIGDAQAERGLRESAAAQAGPPPVSAGRLSDEEHDAVEAWLETQVRAGSPLDRDAQGRIDRSYRANGDEDVAGDIRAGLTPAPVEMTLYRGQALDEAAAGGLLSFSLSRATAEGFGRLVEVKIPAGTPIYSPRSGISGGEILIPVEEARRLIPELDDAPTAGPAGSAGSADPEDALSIDDFRGVAEVEFRNPDKTVHSLQDILADLDADEDLETVLEICPTGRPA
ncbi:phage tail tip lysozyme [Pseudooceanicola algae]|uniref:Phage tail lysozyme domain-containing protein n=1 Tax=Pseudooceanicola algae TaxID=1537215 RepID=A0A418SK47_9RHOB|nr:phage tail tip lysozyme [Pseudooceanicola algae]QPM89159.1 hypothetical protein PSAL_003700 [Pseudooceanicola algae]